MQTQSKYFLAKKIIKQGIKDKISFTELRERLPDWRKRPLQSLIFDVMAEMGLKHVPFPGLLIRPRLSRKPIQISSDGKLSIRELLDEKGFSASDCLAYAHIGDRKITLTIKQDKNLNNLEEQR